MWNKTVTARRSYTLGWYLRASAMGRSSKESRLPPGSISCSWCPIYTVLEHSIHHSPLTSLGFSNVSPGVCQDWGCGSRRDQSPNHSQWDTMKLFFTVLGSLAPTHMLKYLKKGKLAPWEYKSTMMKTVHVSPGVIRVTWRKSKDWNVQDGHGLLHETFQTCRNTALLLAFHHAPDF